MSRKMVLPAAALLLGLGSAPAAFARQPEAASWKVLEAAREGTFRPGLTPGGDTQVLLELFPSDEQFFQSPLLVVFPGCGEDPASSNRPILNLEEVLRKPDTPAVYPADWKDPGPRWRMCPSDSAFLLEDQQHSFFVSVDFLRATPEGLSPRLSGEVHILSEEDLAKLDRGKDIGSQWPAIVGRRAPAAHIVVDLYYRLDPQKEMFFNGDYHEVFGKPGPDMIESAKFTGDHLKDAADLPIDLLSFRSNLRIPRKTQDDGGRQFALTLARAQNAGSGLVGEKFCTRESYDVLPSGIPLEGEDDDVDAAPALRSGPRLGPLATYSLSGRFSTKWSADHSLHSGFGFRAEAWSDDSGSWHRLASDWVQSDGTWALTVSSGAFFAGSHLRMYYVTKTDYYDAQDISGNHYAWRDPDVFSVPLSFNAGHRYADTDGGTYNGVGEMVDAAMYTWSRLYWQGGINPVRSAPINLIAPNTGLACGGTSPWSCANPSGNIWLIAAHASQAQVVSHELGHQLNYKFWNGKRPANAGGSHSLNTCYPAKLGMTLLEGFADFLAGWVGYQGRNVADGGFGSGRWTLGWDLESRVSPPSCTNGWENEVWVARTFWDLHDTRSDGSDILWFINLGAVPALYLGNGIASDGDARDMRFYETIYRNAASPGHQTFISDIFDQNRH